MVLTVTYRRHIWFLQLHICMFQVTTATTLMENNIDEQLIMNRTGHRSLTAVRLYKRPSSQAQKAISDLLQPPKPKNPCTVPSECPGAPPEKDASCVIESATSTMSSSVCQSVEGRSSNLEGSNIGIQSQNANIQNATVLGNVTLPKDCSLNINTPSASISPGDSDIVPRSPDDKMITINVRRADKFGTIQL